MLPSVLSSCSAAETPAALPARSSTSAAEVREADRPEEQVRGEGRPAGVDQQQHSQDVGDDADGPAVHSLAVGLLSQDLRGCKEERTDVVVTASCGAHAAGQRSHVLRLDELLDVSRGSPARPPPQQSSPTYPGVPQAVAITSPVPSILDRPKSLIMILESSSGLKYRRFSGCNGKNRVRSPGGPWGAGRSQGLSPAPSGLCARCPWSAGS